MGSLAGILGPTSLMRRGISSTFIWVKWPFFCSRVDKVLQRHETPPHILGFHLVHTVGCLDPWFIIVQDILSSLHRNNVALVQTTKFPVFSLCFKHLNQPSDPVPPSYNHRPAQANHSQIISSLLTTQFCSNFS